MRAATIALGVLVLAIFCLGYQAAAQVAQPHCCTNVQAPPTATPTPPHGVETTAPFQVYMGETGDPCGPGGGQGKDPGAAADAALGKSSGFIAETCALSDLSGTVLRQNCPGWNENTFEGTGVGCLAVWYEDIFLNPCATNGEKAAYNYAIASNELAFLHTYPNPLTSGNRISSSGGACGGTNTLRFNPGNPAFDAWMTTNVWGNLSLYPTPNPAPAHRANSTFGFMEDNAEIGQTTWVHNSSEYGGNSATSGFSFILGNGTFHVGYTALAGLANFFNTTGIPSEANMMGGGAAWCSTKVGTDCYGSQQYSQGVFDLQLRTDQICQALTSTNLKTILAERVVVNSGEAFNALSNITTMINTMANFVNDNQTNDCASVRFVDLDEAIFPPSTLANDARWEELALYSMVPSNSGVNDEMWPFWYTAGRTSTELSIWPDRQIVAYGPENKPADFVWGGTVNTNSGSGCPANSDRGGAVALLVFYSTSTGACIFAQQYKHCLVNGADQGPCEYLLNPTSATATITSAFCPNDPCTIYGASAAFTGFELSSLNGINLSAGCSNATYCNGALVWAGNKFQVGVTTIGPNSGMLLNTATVQPPPPGKAYIYTGCGPSIQVYNGSAGQPDPIMNLDISNTSTYHVDPNSSNIMSLHGTLKFDTSPTDGLEIVNCGTSSIPYLVPVKTPGSSHPPVQCNTNQPGFGPYPNSTLGCVGTTAQWKGGSFFFEGTFPNGNCSPNDCHWIILDTVNHVDTEGGGEDGDNTWNGTTLQVFSGEQLNLNASFTNNWLPNGGAFSNSTGDSGIPQLGTDLFRSDMANAIANSSHIYHPLNLILPTSASICFHSASCSQTAPYGQNISATTPGADGGCGQSGNGLSTCVWYGDLLRLHSNFSSTACSSGDAQVPQLVWTLQHMGIYLSDTGSLMQLRTGHDTVSYPALDSAFWACLGSIHLSDFDIILRGTTKP